MGFKVLIFAATLAIARAGNLIASAPAVATYSSAPAVSSAYFHQASAPVAVGHAAPVAYHAPAPVAYHAPAPVASYAPAPVAYHAPAPALAVAHSVHAPSVGYSEQNVARSLGGAQSVSTYSKAVDSAFSSVRKYDTRITNDALSLGHAPVSYSQPILTKSYAAPASYAYSAPLVTKSYAAAAPISYSAPFVTKTYAAAPAPLAYATQALAHPTPLAYKTYAAAAPVAYSSPVVTKSYAAAPVAYAQPAHLIAKQVAPVATYASAAPVITKTAVSYSPAAVVAHTNFEGYGVEYHY